MAEKMNFRFFGLKTEAEGIKSVRIAAGVTIVGLIAFVAASWFGVAPIADAFADLLSHWLMKLKL
ncbi:MAG: hypothetical protein CVT79_03595 [Alphaproteobacteria bacterium HGW-Alphaproteobacteria-18]|nr:MAG: hypothetical protein CVT79_03595 [Alphaproteobacteria bacterium HGW-Alphaproteobacteria-18]